jgi:hypothetical protein
VPRLKASRVRDVTSRGPRGDRARPLASARRRNPSLRIGAVRLDPPAPVPCVPSRGGLRTGVLPGSSSRGIGQVRPSALPRSRSSRQRPVAARARSHHFVPRRLRALHCLAASTNQHHESTPGRAVSVQSGPGHRSRSTGLLAAPSHRPVSVRARPVDPFTRPVLAPRLPPRPRAAPNRSHARLAVLRSRGPERPGASPWLRLPTPPASSSSGKARNQGPQRVTSWANTAVKRTRSAPLRSPLTANR